MGEGAGPGLLGEQIARGGEPLGGSLADLLAQALDDAFLARRKRRQGLVLWCHADPFPNAPAAARPAARRAAGVPGAAEAPGARSVLQVTNLLGRKAGPRHDGATTEAD